MTPARRTPLHQSHLQLGARMAPFAGWDMPISYSTISEEHETVRQRVGLFDVSHMGEVEVRGPGALDLLQHTTVNDVSRLSPGRIQYTAMLNPEGGVIDDLLIYHLDVDLYMLVVNAANTAHDLEWLRGQNRTVATVEDISASTVLLSVQGPRSVATLQPLVNIPLDALGYYRWAACSIDRTSGRISRTGYTGEDGFEFYFSSSAPEEVWRAILEAGRSYGIRPAGLGARNTLRLEAGMLLHGSDMDETTSPIEAGLERIVKLDKGAFVGRDVLARQAAEGVERKLVGFEMLGRDIAREGATAGVAGQEVGRVTSGGPSITLKKNIGMAYLPIRYSDPGARFTVRVRRRDCDAEVVSTPFYSRRRAA